MVMRSVSIALAVLLLALPAEAQMRKPGADFYSEPEWSEAFTQGMIAVQKRDLVKAEELFRKCVDEAKTPDANCEYYLGLMYYARGDLENWRKWLYAAASHGQPMAVMALDLMERFK